ncbi:hypothetical protein Tco_0174078 [Tanacetum coccineum]
MIRGVCTAMKAIDFLEACHNGPRADNTKQNLTARRKDFDAGFFWPSLFKDATETGCDTCPLGQTKWDDALLGLPYSVTKHPSGALPYKLVYEGHVPGFLKPLVLAVFVLRSQELHNPQLHLGIPIS